MFAMKQLVFAMGVCNLYVHVHVHTCTSLCVLVFFIFHRLNKQQKN